MTTKTSNILKSYYQSLYKEYGDSHKSVQHVSKESQNVRFAIFLDMISSSSRVIDLGCGLGDMLLYLRKNGFTGEYLGYDFVPEFIDVASAKFSSDAKAQFEVFDIYKDEIAQGYDHVLISGVFNNKMTDNIGFLTLTLQKSIRQCEKSVVFNALSTFVEFKNEALFYVSPLELFELCKTTMTPFVSLKHDYVTKPGGYPYEFTMQLSKSETTCY